MIHTKNILLSVLLTGAVLVALSLPNSAGVQAVSAGTLARRPTRAPGSVRPPGVYYVSTGGRDSNRGTLASPWRHIQYALDHVGAGSTVNVLGGVYREFVTFPRSGSPSKGYIVLQNYAGQHAVIDGTGLAVSGEKGLVNIVNRQYVKLIGFDVRNLRGGGLPSAFPQGISVRGRGAFIEIRNNKVHNIRNSCGNCGAHGIAVYGRDPNASIHDLLIDGNEVYNGKFGWSESLVLNGNVELFTVSNNIVHDNDNIGIDFIGFEGENPNPAVDRARDGTVTGNLVYNINSFGNPAYGDDRSADGIYVDGGTRILIERNIVHHANLGIELASEHAGKNTSYITLRNNFLYNNTQAGIALGGYDTKRGSTRNCVIVNNTLYNNYTQRDWGGELYIQYDTRNNIIKNNVIFANDARLFVDSWSAVMTGNVVDHNLFFALGGGTAGTWIWKEVTYSTFAAYQAASGNDTHGLIGVDPLLADPASGDLHLQSASPAIDRGQSLPEAGTLDIDGQARIQGAAIDLGADEVR
jgi:hypothetical protein